jgi:DNA invertase Pin-like site-specific DNA recombinase
VSLLGKRIAIYARFSSDNQRDASIEDQVRLCHAYVERNGGSTSDALILADRAMSGATKDRPQFERLQRLVQLGEVNVIITESGDRLSRDLGDSDRLWKLVSFHNVRLVCVSDGIDSDQESSRMNFRFKAVFADEYLTDLGKKTSRGLRGAAANGRATGGLPYGYVSKAVLNAKAEPIGYDIEVDVERADTVRRIFEMYRTGYSYLTIAKTLNDDLVPPPRVESKRPSKFWKKGTVREMLRNVAYIGQWNYGRKKWKRDPETRKRRYSMQAAENVMSSVRPHLRIIDDALWNEVRVRSDAVRDNYKGAGPAVGAAGHRTKHPLSGLLFCGVCGHRMVDGGGSPRRYRCSAASTGGACTNQSRIREEQLVDAAISELKRLLFQTDLHEQMQQKIEARVARYKVKTNDEKGVLTKELARADNEMNRLLAFLKTTDPATMPGAFEAVRTSMEAAANERKIIAGKLAALQPQAAPQLPTVAEIKAFVTDVEARLRDDPTATREALRQALGDGRIVLHPQPDGTWRAESTIIIGKLAGTRPSRRTVAGSSANATPAAGAKTREPRSGEPSGVSGIATTGEVVEIGCCAGTIPGLDQAVIEALSFSLAA